MTPGIDPAAYDRWKLANPDNEDVERERAVRMSYEDRADELYQAWKDGDL